MATIDLGKISFTQKGTWASGTTYEAKDVVQYTDDNETSSYVAIASSTNQAPSTNGTVNTSYWALFAKGATVGSTNQGVWDVATAYQKNAVVQYTDAGVVSTYLAVADSTGETPSTAGTVNSSYWQLIAKGTDSVGLSWQSSIVTGTTLTALAGNGYFINTTSNACTITLPATASVGDTIEFVDYARTWNTNPITLNLNSLNYQGLSGITPEYNSQGQHLKIVYSGATKGWLATDDDPSENKEVVGVEYLVVAGGGSGGAGEGGGGGAGGFLTNYGTSTLNLSVGETYTVSVGAGGSGVPGSPKTQGNNGSNSFISGNGIASVTAFGGGGGGASSLSPGGKDGGSGGGSSSTPATLGGSGTVGQGNDAGDGIRTGGGGAGVASASVDESAGGNGLQSSIDGTATYYAGGGGGGHGGQPGGLGGGTTGVNNPNSSSSSPANSGGGSGGCNDFSTGNGGSGIVIIRIPTADYTGTVTGSPTVTTSGTDTIIKYTASGTYTA